MYMELWQWRKTMGFSTSRFQKGRIVLTGERHRADEHPRGLGREGIYR